MSILSEKKSKKSIYKQTYKVGSVCCLASTTDPTRNWWCQKRPSLSRCLSIRAWVLSITRIRPQNFLVLFCSFLVAIIYLSTGCSGFSSTKRSLVLFCSFWLQIIYLLFLSNNETQRLRKEEE